MNKRELAILEKAFSCEIESALRETNKCHLLQTKSKIAEALCHDGHLRLTSYVIGGRFPVHINGYELTELGRLAYCTSDLCNKEKA